MKYLYPRVAELWVRKEGDLFVFVVDVNETQMVKYYIVENESHNDSGRCYLLQCDDFVMLYDRIF